MSSFINGLPTFRSVSDRSNLAKESLQYIYNQKVIGRAAYTSAAYITNDFNKTWIAARVVSVLVMETIEQNLSLEKYLENLLAHFIVDSVIECIAEKAIVLRKKLWIVSTFVGITILYLIEDILVPKTVVDHHRIPLFIILHCLVERICSDLIENNPYFTQRPLRVKGA